MGVYIFKSIHDHWYKIGSFKTSEQKPNVYFRVVGLKGFDTCRKIPISIKGRVGVDDLVLVRWFPNLCMKDEKEIYKVLIRRFPRVYGEWIFTKDIGEVIWIIEEMFKGRSENVGEECKEMAREWGLKQYLKHATNHHTRLL